jgi:hypothetical protein
MQPTAQAVGERHKTYEAPEGRKRLIPDVALVVSHLVLLEERKELFLKRLFLVMFFLFYSAMYFVTAATFDSLTLNTQ